VAALRLVLLTAGYTLKNGERGGGGRGGVRTFKGRRERDGSEATARVWRRAFHIKKKKGKTLTFRETRSNGNRILG